MTNKIDINKQYKTRSGLLVRIYAVDGYGEYSIHGSYFDNDGWNCITWHESGYCYENGLNDDLDLIEYTGE